MRCIGGGDEGWCIVMRCIGRGLLVAMLVCDVLFQCAGEAEWEWCGIGICGWLFFGEYFVRGFGVIHDEAKVCGVPLDKEDSFLERDVLGV